MRNNMKKKKNIVITNAYTWYNKGDAGILLGIVNSLKEIYGDGNVDIKILSFTPDIDSEKYCKDTNISSVHSNVLNPHPYKRTKIGKIIAIIKLFIRMVYLFLMQKFSLKHLVKKEKSYEILDSADFIVVCGGGFLGGKKFDSLMHLFQIYVNTLFNKKVIVMGTSIEPMKNKFIKNITERCLKKVDCIYARETITYEYLKTFMPLEKIILIPDMAFMLGEEEYDSDIVESIKKNTDTIFGITVRNWKFPNISDKPDVAMKRYMQAIADMMEKYIEEKNAYFIFVPQVTVYTGDDTVVAEKIKMLLPEDKRERFIILKEDISPMQIKTLISNFSFFIGTRMHSNIFATSMMVPTVAIAYEKKTNGIMETVGLEDYIVEIDTITTECLINKIDKCIENQKEIKNELNKNIPKLKNRIMMRIKDDFLSMEINKNESSIYF